MQVAGGIQTNAIRKLAQAMKTTSELIQKCDESSLLRLGDKAFTRERLIAQADIRHDKILVTIKIRHKQGNGGD